MFSSKFKINILTYVLIKSISKTFLSLFNNVNTKCLLGLYTTRKLNSVTLKVLSYIGLICFKNCLFYIS